MIERQNKFCKQAIYRTFFIKNQLQINLREVKRVFVDMQIIRIILASAWVGISSIAVVGGAYVIMRSPPPEWIQVVRFGRSTIRLIDRIVKILEQLDGQDNEQQDDQQSD